MGKFTDDDMHEAAKEHISMIETMNLAFLGISLSLLVFPLSLYTPETPYLLFLALLGYFCSWGFLINIESKR